MDQAKRKSPFIISLLTSLVVDLFIILATPVLGYLSGVLFIAISPLVLSAAAPDAMNWLRDEHPRRCGWWAMGRALSGVSLLFLVGVLVLSLWVPTQDIWLVLLYIYLLLAAFRLTGAAMVNLLVAPITFWKGRELLTKLDSVASVLCSATGLYLWRQIAQSPAFYTALSSGLGPWAEPGSLAAYLILFCAVLLSFFSGLVWGTSLHWLVSRQRPSRT